jgi:hypothetical protein
MCSAPVGEGAKRKRGGVGREVMLIGGHVSTAAEPARRRGGGGAQPYRDASDEVSVLNCGLTRKRCGAAEQEALSVGDPDLCEAL